MNLRNVQILVSSIDKALNRAKISGKLDTTIIFLFNTLIYYRNFIQDTINSGFNGYKDYKDIIDVYISKFIYKYSDILCNYKISSGISSNIPIGNINPSVNTLLIDINTNSEYIFTISKIIENFTSADNIPYNKVLLNLNNVSGTFYYNNIVVTGILEINVLDIINLKYVRADENIFSDTITYRVNDINNLYSNEANINIIGALITTNNSATIGDIAVYSSNRFITTLTLEMFTSQLTPPYSDPEGDLIDAIRIDEISTANSGLFKLNGNAISEGIIISKQDLIDGIFTHSGPDADGLSSDVINFSARDAGSLIWVQ